MAVSGLGFLKLSWYLGLLQSLYSFQKIVRVSTVVSRLLQVQAVGVKGFLGFEVTREKKV